MKVRKEVLKFSKIMEEKLSENDSKNGWSNCTNQYLFHLLLKEVAELSELIFNDSIEPVELRRECADVANFAMMISDNNPD
jgi:hypothetical protein